MREAEKFLCAAAGDCGIANVNPEQAEREIGGAFGGEKRPAAAVKAEAIRGRCYAPANKHDYYSTELPGPGIQFRRDGVARLRRSEMRAFAAIVPAVCVVQLHRR